MCTTIENRLMQSLDRPTRERVAALERAAAAGVEPDSAAVAAVFPPLRYHSTIVGVAHHRDRIHVCWDGTLVSVGVAQVRMTLGEERTPWRELDAEPTHDLLDGYLPVVVTTLRHADLVVRQTVVGYSEGLSPDRPLLALAKLEVCNPNGAAASLHLGFAFERGLTLQQARAEEAAAFGDHALVRDGRFVEWDQGGLIAACDARFAATAEWRCHILAGTLAVPAGGCASVELRLARRPLAPAQRATLTDPEFGAVVTATARCWRGWLQRGAQLELPDPETCAAFRAWAIYGALLSGREQGRIEPHDAPDFYEHFYGHAAACYLHTLSFRGDFEEARLVAASMLAWQRPDGMFSGERRVSHQHGSMLRELCRLYLMSDDRAWFATVLHHVEQACEWIIRERRKSMQREADGSQPLTWGLLPAHLYCVDEVASLTMAQDYLADALNWAGLQEAATALSRFGADAARRIAAEAQSYRDDLLASMRRALERGAPPFLPLVPGREHPYGYLPDSREGNYYAILAPRMLEAELFARDDELALVVSDFLEARGGLVLGLSTFRGNFPTRRRAPGADHAELGIDAHFVYGYALANLRHDRVARYLLTYRGILAYGMSKGTFAPPECSLITSGQGPYTPASKRFEWCAMPQPHLHSLAQMLRVVRMLLVQEEDDTLWLARATPREWLAPGKQLCVSHAATIFGRVSFTIASTHGADGAIELVVTIAVQWHHPPARTFLRLRHPGRRGIAALAVEGASHRHYDGETIELTELAAGARLVATLEP
jgi:hypothetical protein